MNENQEKLFISSSLVFLVLGAAMLGVIMFVSVKFFPPDQRWQFGGQSAAQRLSWMQRLLKGPSIKYQRDQQRVKNKSLKVQHAGGGGVPSTLTSKEQMIFRQTLIAQQILSNYQGLSNHEAWEKMRNLPGEGPWKTYEIDRIKTRLLLEDYDRNRDPNLLSDMLPTARTAAQSPYSNFEDYFYAGVAEIYSGNNQKAEPLFTKAQEQWPVKDLLYGLNSMFLTSCLAIRNDPESLTKIEGFKEDFPDWLYSEIYLPEFEQMTRTYPRSALLPALHGRVLSMTFNDARAAGQYKRALAHRQLPPAARTILRSWQEELKLYRRSEGGS